MCLRSWIRRTGATADHTNARLTTEACGWWPVLVVSSRSSGPLLSPQAWTSGNTRSAIGTLRLLPDLVTFAATPSGAARLTNSTGIGTRTKSRTRTSRSSDHRSPVHAATRSTFASRWSLAPAAM